MPETPADQPNISRVWMGADDALGDDDAVGVADRISSGEISAAEAVDAAIDLLGFGRATQKITEVVQARLAQLTQAGRLVRSHDALTLPV